MNLKHLALGAALATTSSFAGIIITESDTAVSLALTLKWDPEAPNPETTSDATGNWHWDVEFMKDASNVTATFNGTHVGGPTFSTVLVVPLAGGAVSAFNIMGHGSAGYDAWNASMQRNPNFLPLVLNVGASHDTTVVPEAQEYALLAGLGLVGFGAWRRFRKS